MIQWLDLECAVFRTAAFSAGAHRIVRCQVTYKTKKNLKKAARTGARAVADVVRLALKTLGIFLLIFITTGAMFACIFVIYIKTNLVSDDPGVTFEEYRLNETSVIYYYDKTAQEWVESTSIKSSEGYMYWVPYEKIPKDMEHALVAIEDKRFYEHHGVDWIRTASAFVHMFAGMENTFGGSTITQQLRKNLTNENEATISRKLTEIFAALELEREYDKWEIIEWYLNIVNFGHGKSRGIGDAARYYFDKDVENLSLAEICSIIGITNNPSMYNPYYHPEANKKRQETILYQMYDQGYITKAQYEEAKAEELHFVYASTSGGSEQVYSWFDEAVRQDAARFLAEQRGITYEMGLSLLATGGFKIYCTMDPDIQADVDEIYASREFIDSLGVTGKTQQDLQSAIVVMDPYTGDIVAMAGAVGEKTGDLVQNMATQTRRPAGSSFKPISTYGPAMELGLITPDTCYEDAPNIQLRGTDWLPTNSDNNYHGIVTIRKAIEQSYNVIAAQVLDDLTTDVSYNFVTEKLHIGLVPEDNGYAALALGQQNYGVTVREMANAFSIFPSGGIYTPSRTFTQIYDADWNLLYENKSDAEAVLSDVTAYWMTDMLHNAAVNGTGKRANLKTMPTAGKTGSSSQYKDRWFVGFTPYYLAAVWTGFPYPVSINDNSNNVSCRIWNAVMSRVHEDLPYRDFTVPANTHQDPVPGIQTVEYTARCMARDGFGGYTFVSEEEGRGIIGHTVTVNAPEIEGYVLQSAASRDIILSEEPGDNVVTFYYTPETPSTEPPITEPPTTEPPTTEPPTTEPPTTEPPTTEPPTDTQPEE